MGHKQFSDDSKIFSIYIKPKFKIVFTRLMKVVWIDGLINLRKKCETFMLTAHENWILISNSTTYCFWWESCWYYQFWFVSVQFITYQSFYNCSRKFVTNFDANQRIHHKQKLFISYIFTQFDLITVFPKYYWLDIRTISSVLFGKTVPRS